MAHDRSRIFPGLILALAATLAGCGTTEPSRFFQLSAKTTAPPEPKSGGPAWAVREVKLPRYLDRSQMIVRKSAHEIELDEYNRWAEPLDAGMARVLQASKTADATEAWRVDIEVLVFDVDEAGEAVLEAAWSARPPRTGPAAAGSFRGTRKAAGKEPEAGVAALSALVAELGDSITEALRLEKP